MAIIEALILFKDVLYSLRVPIRNVNRPIISPEPCPPGLLSMKTLPVHPLSLDQAISRDLIGRPLADHGKGRAGIIGASGDN